MRMIGRFFIKSIHGEQEQPGGYAEGSRKGRYAKWKHQYVHTRLNEYGDQYP